MLHLARSLRTALLTTVLVGAVAAPAVAAPAAGTTTPKAIGATAKLKVTQDRDYDIRVRNNGGVARAWGEFEFGRRELDHDGYLRDTGRGRSVVTFLNYPERGRVIVRSFTANDRRVETDYDLRGDFDRVTVVVCKIIGRDTECRSRTFRDRDR